jgi:hypothetical protein
MRILLYFDFSALPAKPYPTIESALLKTTVSHFQDLQSETYTIGVYRVIESGTRTPWVEGLGTDWPPAMGCVSVDSAAGVAWQGNPAQGGVDQPEFDPTASAVAVVVQTQTPRWTVVTWDITQLVTKWRTGEYPN